MQKLTHIEQLLLCKKVISNVLLKCVHIQIYLISLKFAYGHMQLIIVEDKAFEIKVIYQILHRLH